MNIGHYSLIALTIGYALDLIIGDPHGIWHPVQGMGWLISRLEKGLRRRFSGGRGSEAIGGGILVLTVLLLSTAIPLGILWAAYTIHPWLGVAAEAVMCCQILATKSLKTESEKVFTALEKEGLGEGRKAVSMIVGRDTENLTEEGVVKAAVETIAENTSDGVIAPMLYLFLGGASLGFFYKAANTMDSMIGYKNEKYRYFGTAAARLDDVLNYIPARISALLLLAAAFFTKGSVKGGWKIFMRDRYHHASPNSAQTESVIAGVLQVELAGDAYYFGKLHKKEAIGDDIRRIEKEDIRRANRLLYTASVIGMLLFTVVKIWIIV